MLRVFLRCRCLRPLGSIGVEAAERRRWWQKQFDGSGVHTALGAYTFSFATFAMDTLLLAVLVLCTDILKPAMMRDLGFDCYCGARQLFRSRRVC
ncbi:hypothetical protein FA95DRAFT_695391 [Auriscalpium vulgare]|uniref:Uncharacterized protein n=1 Tax=Auriscalpium vulgare TaxID=40419 RepID=A0ACB8RB76_9AGAM|nr:hypothetical protein FA95DRAFT_695391 [Auriscalpium vulgare]